MIGMIFSALISTREWLASFPIFDKAFHSFAPVNVRCPKFLGLVVLVLSGLVCAEGQVIDLLDELFVTPLEGKAETDQPGALGDVDETPGTDHAAAQATHVDIAELIDLAGAHESRVESPTVVEIKLAGMRDDRGRMRRDPEVDGCLDAGRSTDEQILDAERRWMARLRNEARTFGAVAVSA